MNQTTLLTPNPVWANEYVAGMPVCPVCASTTLHRVTSTGGEGNLWRVFECAHAPCPGKWTEFYTLITLRIEDQSRIDAGDDCEEFEIHDNDLHEDAMLAALEQARAALPDAWLAVKCNVPRDLIELLDTTIAVAVERRRCRARSSDTAHSNANSTRDLRPTTASAAV